jgi:hypothetical protein
MIRTLLAAIALAVGVGGEVVPPEATAPAPFSRPPSPVFGIVRNETGLMRARLTRVKSATLEPVGRRLRLGLGGASATAFSPDHHMLALGNGTRPDIELIDLRHMTRVGRVKLGLGGWVTFLSWQRGYLFAVVDGGGDPAVAVVDSTGRRVLRLHRLERTILGVQEGPPGTIDLLTAPHTGIGPVVLTVVGSKGMASVTVAGISGGSKTRNDASGFRARQLTPALAIDKRERRAVIVPGGETVAEVSLRNLAVTYHSLSQPVSLLGRLRNWLEPVAAAKVLEGPQRKAASLGNGLIALSGADYSISTDQNGDQTMDVDPAGVSLIDTARWSIRTIDEEATDLALVGNTLLAFGIADWGGSPADGFGVVGYDLEGEERFHVLDGTGVGGIQTVGGRAYVTLDEKRYTVLDVASGRIVARLETKKPIALVAD